MTDFTDEQLAARELRDAAYHEAGHKVLYERFGGAGDAVVSRNGSGNVEERAWLGQFRPRTCPETMHKIASPHSFPASQLPANWKIQVGMAGLVAEIILSGEADDVGAVADILCERISSGEASASDLAGMGVSDIDDCELSYEVIEAAVQLLRAEWPAVQREAEYLISAADESRPLRNVASASDQRANAEGVSGGFFSPA
ncbi:hypothetical protein OKW30_003537 [Paraburkholderia sp. Clong3]|uniref:hypothetical protein n=1 Tax=Paraburkholderia sp. Clong3 TaxID=2991061 RepID=UPI003D2080B7